MVTEETEQELLKNTTKQITKKVAARLDRCKEHYTRKKGYGSLSDNVFLDVLAELYEREEMD